MDEARVVLKTESLGLGWFHPKEKLCPSAKKFLANLRSTARRPRLRVQINAYACETTDPTTVRWQDDFDDQYTLGKLIGRGSFGEVFIAVDRYTGEEVAVKEMPMTRGSLSAERTLQKITREALVMNLMRDCPAVVKLLGCFRRADRYRIVMEFCGGRDLNYHLKNFGPFSELQAVLVAYEVLKVVCACHDRNVVHGDVKTANFVLKNLQCNPFKHNGPSLLKSGWLKAIDFGCSQFVDDFVRIRSRVGSPVFMAPEVFQRNYSCESDLWSLGVLLYQLAAGRFPFWSSEEAASISTVHDVMAVVTARDPDFSYGPWSSFSPEGLDFLQGLLDKNYLSRLTADEAFNHPWIRKHIQRDSHGDVLVNNIVPTGTVLGEAAETELAMPGLVFP